MVAVRAGRPLTVDDAGTVAPGECEVEAGVAFDQNNGDRHWDFPAGVTVGILPTLDLTVMHGFQTGEHELFDGSWDTKTGHNDVVLGVKWNPLSEERFRLAQSLAFSIKLPTACEGYGNGETDYDLTYIVSRTVCESWSAHLNSGYTWVGDSSHDDLFHCGAAVGWLAIERIELVSELFAEIPVTDCGQATLMINGGIRWVLCEGVILDAAAGTDLRQSEPDWTATIGLTWTFGLWKRKSPES